MKVGELRKQLEEMLKDIPDDWDVITKDKNNVRLFDVQIVVREPFKGKSLGALFG